MEPREKTPASALLRCWTLYHGSVYRIAAVLMALLAVVWLAYGFWRLVWGMAPLWPGSPEGAVDLEQRYVAVNAWFRSRPVYGAIGEAVYPPASYMILWPFLGWLGFAAARRLWAAAIVATLGWLIWLIVRESRASTKLERCFLALTPLAMYPVGAATGNGQFIILVLPLILAGLFVLDRRGDRDANVALASLLILLALVQPTIAAPFFWIVVFRPQKLRAAWLVVIGYVALTLFALPFQVFLVSETVSPAAVIDKWAERGVEGVIYSSIDGGHLNVHNALAWVRRSRWCMQVSLIVLLAHGLWVNRNRHIDLWILIGVTAIVARLWVCHRWYNDLLILLPMVVLFRAAKGGPGSGRGAVPGVLFALNLLIMLAPGGLYILPSPWLDLYLGVEFSIWMMTLTFLLDAARREKRAAETPVTA